ncbi:nicotianamine aminotransferase 1-like [Salvia miltiorrhiza]|uniref:nicotianamine aminotransferase 1-like n=1 Tax=Salvia miltiorrhiza TaxID=226208 RepID=UPI0025AB8FD2|nr:nicotianamine aminotransferase 1-like [Salvia miltiorrhiza]
MAKRWRFEGSQHVIGAGAMTLRGVMDGVMKNMDGDDGRHVIHLSQGDPSAFPSFRTAAFAEDAVCAAVRSAQFNGYSSTAGLPAARSAVAEYLSKDLPYDLSSDDVFLTIGCTQALEAILTALARPGANILLPRPGYPDYEARAAFAGLEVRHFDLDPENDWEADLAAVEALGDDHTVAIVVINPGNPCGNVFKYDHLKKIAEMARNMGILVIADEVYGHLTFGSNPFVPMGVFASIAPIITLGSLSKRWIVPGWRIGWLVLNDLHGILTKHGIVDSIKGFLNISSDPVTFIQAALPEILLKTPTDFYDKIVSMFRESAEKCYKLSQQIPCISCPTKPQGCMFLMIKLNLSMLEGICCKLAKEESVILLPGTGLGLKNWLRVTFAVEASHIDEGFRRIRAFCERHAISKKETTLSYYVESPVFDYIYV